VNVESSKRRILYVEGEPRWEYKFIRRAEQDDRIVSVVSMLRTSENKIYRQGISDPKELADGFPSRVEDLFDYQALIVGSVEASYLQLRSKNCSSSLSIAAEEACSCSVAGHPWVMEVGAFQILQTFFQLSCRTRKAHSTAIRPPWNLLLLAPTTSSRGSWKTRRGTWNAGKNCRT